MNLPFWPHSDPSVICYDPRYTTWYECTSPWCWPWPEVWNNVFNETLTQQWRTCGVFCWNMGDVYPETISDTQNTARVLNRHTTHVPLYTVKHKHSSHTPVTCLHTQTHTFRVYVHVCADVSDLKTNTEKHKLQTQDFALRNNNKLYLFRTFHSTKCISVCFTWNRSFKTELIKTLKDNKIFKEGSKKG